MKGPLTRASSSDARGRLLHDLDVIGRMERNDRAPAAARLRAAVGDELSEVARRSLVEPRIPRRRTHQGEAA